MSIPKSDVWVVEVTEYGAGQVVHLNRKDSAPDEFSSEAEIESYIQDTFAIGEYYVLGVQNSVTVTPEDEMYSEYSTNDIEVIESANERLVGEDRVVSVSRVSDPTGFDISVENSGVSLELSAYACDLHVEVRNPDDESEESVVEWVSERCDGLRVVGYERDTYYEQRGSRGEQTLRVALKRDVGSVKELQEYISSISGVGFCTPVDSLVFVPRVSPQNQETEQVVVTETVLETAGRSLGDDPTPTSVLETMALEFETFEENVTHDTQWCVTDIGFVPAVDGEFKYWLAIGVALDE